MCVAAYGRHPVIEAQCPNQISFQINLLFFISILKNFKFKNREGNGFTRWRDGSTVKSQVQFSGPIWSSTWLPVTPAPRDSVPSSGSCQAIHTDTKSNWFLEDDFVLC